MFVIIVIVIAEEINRTPFHEKAGKCPSVYRDFLEYKSKFCGMLW